MGDRRRYHPLRAWLPFILAAVVVSGFGLAGRRTADGPLPPIDSTRVCRVTSVQDGDTVTVRCEGGALRVRLWGLDAPELGQRPWGERSRAALVGDLPASVALTTVDHDRYGRAVARLYQGERDLGLALLRAGWAAVYRRYNDDPVYLAAEAEARRASRGIWAEPGFQQTPWQWRRFNAPGGSR